MFRIISKNNWVLFLIFFTIFSINIIVEAKVEFAAYINAIDYENLAIKLGESWYYLTEDYQICRNGMESQLGSCHPIAGQAQWAVVIIDKGLIKKINIEYKVIEGVITKISLLDEYLELEPFLQDNTTEKTNLRLYWKSGIATGLDLPIGLIAGTHLVLISSGDRILKIVRD